VQGRLAASERAIDVVVTAAVVTLTRQNVER
jgi:hypothetical protein